MKTSLFPCYHSCYKKPNAFPMSEMLVHILTSFLSLELKSISSLSVLPHIVVPCLN